MDLRQIAERFEHNARIFEHLVSDVSDDQARWKPAARKWSILEVVNHLADEEVLDFRTRLDLVLHKPGEPWAAIDPERWVVERRYNERELGESLARFLAEREDSIAWLAALDEPNWHNTYRHPALGELRAGDVLTSWLAHDLLHIRQITRLHYQYLAESLPGYGTAYAGAW